MTSANSISPSAGRRWCFNDRLISSTVIRPRFITSRLRYSAEISANVSGAAILAGRTPVLISATISAASALASAMLIMVCVTDAAPEMILPPGSRQTTCHVLLLPLMRTHRPLVPRIADSAGLACSERRNCFVGEIPSSHVPSPLA